jgi:hypothetical protein
MVREKRERLSADVKTTAYLKFRRVYEDALKAHAGGRPLESGLVLARSLLHVPPLLAAAKDEPIPGPKRLVDWVMQQDSKVQSLFRKALCRPQLEARHGAAAELDGMLREALPLPGRLWESGRMRFGRGFSTDTLFFAQSNLRLFRWWDSRRDRGEIRPALERFFDVVRREAPRDGRGFRDSLIAAFNDVPGLRAMLIFGSSADQNWAWNDSEGKDVDLALFGRGLWFRRAVCSQDGIHLDIVRLPEAGLKRGVEAEDDMISNALVGAEVLRDDGGTCAALQKRVRARYAGGKARPQGEARERLEDEMTTWPEWARPQGEKLPDWIRLEAALAQILKIGFRLGGRWFPADQDLLESLRAWTSEGADLLEAYLRARDPGGAISSLETLCETFCNVDVPLSDRARAALSASGEGVDREGVSGSGEKSICRARREPAGRAGVFR